MYLTRFRTYKIALPQCCGSGMFIPDPGSDFFPSRIQGSKKHPIPDPGSGSATLLYHPKGLRQINT